MAVKPLTKKQELAVQLMLDGFSKKEIQRRLNISQPTLYRWQQLPAWHEAVETAVRADTKTGEVQLKSLMPLATRAVHKLLLTGADNIKLGASRLVFETVAHMLQREEQQQMLQALEEQVAQLRDAARERRLPESVIDAVEVELNPDTHGATDDRALPKHSVALGMPRPLGDYRAPSVQNPCKWAAYPA